MNLSINGQSQVPPGFRFHPTEEELLHYYLRKKVAFERIDLDVIREVDLNKLEPWDIQEKCKIGSAPQNDWYFFSHKDKKYPTGTRTNRATAVGFWKATGRDKIIYSGFRRIGLRKTLVFYKGRAPHGQKSDWIMHEYRLDDSNATTTTNNYDSTNSIPIGEGASEEGWVVCRVFRKKNYHKVLDHSPKGSTLISTDSKTKIMATTSNNEDGILDQILLYMGRNSKLNVQEADTYNPRFLSTHNHLNMSMSNFNEATIMNDRSFLHLPRLDSPSPSPSPSSNNFKSCYDEIMTTSNDPNNIITSPSINGLDETKSGLINNWVTFDRLVASQLNGHEETPKQLACFTSNDHDHDDQDPSFSFSPDDDDHEMLQRSGSNATLYSENDLWSFTKPTSSPSSSSIDPLCHLSV